MSSILITGASKGIEQAIGQAGDIDVLISNAGVIFSAAVEASPIPEIERQQVA